MYIEHPTIWYIDIRGTPLKKKIMKPHTSESLPKSSLQTLEYVANTP